MLRKLITVSAASLAIGVPTASADTTIIGNVLQSNSQAANCSQSGLNGSGGGNTYILGNSTPTLIQSCSNVLSNTQSIGAPAYPGVATANFTLIGNAAQINSQGANIQQVGVNGDGRLGGTTFIGGDSAPFLSQSALNVLFNDVILG